MSVDIKDYNNTKEKYLEFEGFMSEIISKKKGVLKTIVLPEGEDSRVIEAAFFATKNKISKVIVLGNKDNIEGITKGLGLEVNFDIIDPSNSDLLNTLSKKYSFLINNKKKNKDKNITITELEAKEILKNDKVLFGAMMCKTEKADGMVAGSISTTRDVLRASLSTIGVENGKRLSSSFLMELEKPTARGNKILMFADCAVNINPNAEQLADIAISSAITYNKLTGEQPKIGFLSFSTYGSGKDESIEKINEAIKIVKNIIDKEKLDILLEDKEVQLDSAINPGVASKKIKKSKLNGEANILIFPDLNSGNIGYKLVQQFAGANSYGPILQGFNKPVNDLSRGCTVKDIYGTIAITSLFSNKD